MRSIAKTESKLKYVDLTVYQLFFKCIQMNIIATLKREPQGGGEGERERGMINSSNL